MDIGIIFIAPVLFLLAAAVVAVLALKVSRSKGVQAAPEAPRRGASGGVLAGVLLVLAAVSAIAGLVLAGASALVGAWPLAVGYLVGGVATAAVFAAIAKGLSNSERIARALEERK